MASPHFAELVDTYRELADIHWLQSQHRILKGKLAHKEDEQSYLGTIYMMEAEREGPTSSQDREKFRGICAEMAALGRQIEDRELELLKESEDAEDQEYVAYIEARRLRDQADRLEEEDSDREMREIEEMLQSRLRALLAQDD